MFTLPMKGSPYLSKCQYLVPLCTQALIGRTQCRKVCADRILWLDIRGDADHNSLSLKFICFFPIHMNLKKNPV